MHALREDLPVEQLGESYETRGAEWGEYTAYFERMSAGLDYTEYYGSCECPHVGYVFKGKIRFIYSDGSEEIIGAGEITETVEFSPTQEYLAHLKKVARNLEPMKRTAER
jgi:hypothetical protein